MNDFRLAVRQLANHRSLTMAAVVALALGMSATTTMFTIIHGVYLRDLPFSDPERIVGIGTRYVNRGPNALDNWSMPDLQDLQQSALLFDGIVAADEEAMDVVDDAHAAERFTGAWVSPNVFEILGHRPVLGRGFVADDGRPGGSAVVVLSHAVWTRRYARDPEIVGKDVRVNGIVSTVIGVMDEGFRFPTGSDLWQPLSIRTGDRISDRGNRNLDVFGRLAAGRTIAQAQADLERVMERLAREFPETNEGVTAVVRPFRELSTSGPIRTVFAGLMGSGAFLLLIACANIGNLLLVRGASRVREVTVRMALGATRWQVVRHLLVESLLLTGVAGLAGLAAAAFGVRAFQQAVAESGPPYWVQVPIEPTVTAFVAVVCLGTAIVCGLGPALQTTKVGLADVLGEAGRAGVGSRRTRRWADVFVVAQVALSVTMLAGAGLWMDNVYAFSRLDSGVDTTGLIAAQVSLPTRRYPDDEARHSFYRQLGERLDGLPGMRAGFTSAAPLRGAVIRRVSAGAKATVDEPVTVSTVMVGPGYLETLGISVLRGRLFGAADAGSRTAGAVANERFAARLFPGEEAVGRTVRLEPLSQTLGAAEFVTIVGVVPNVRQANPRQPGVDVSDVESVLYLSYASNPPPVSTIVVRSNAGAAAVAGVVRGAIGEIDPDLPLVGGVMPLGEAIDQELGLLIVFASMFGLFAAAATGLATVGVFGVTAFGVTQRTREIGVRLALGAGSWQVCWTLARRVALQLSVGLSIGAAGAVGVRRLLELGSVSRMANHDSAILLAVSLLMGILGCVACLVPSARAVRVDPVAALRTE